MKETTPVLCYGNSKTESRPYIRTSQETLSRAKDIFQEGASCKEAFKINSLPWGIYESCSQSNEL